MDEVKLMAVAKPWLNFLEKLHDFLLESAEKISFDKKESTQRCVMMLHGSMIELAGSCTVLFQKKMVAAIPSIMRDMLENLANAKNLINDPAYNYSMQLKDSKVQVKMLNAAKSGKNQFLRVLGAFPDLNKNIDKYKDDISELEKNYKVLSIREIFEKAGMVDWYDAIYALFSSHPHSGLSALYKRHLAYEESDFSVVFYKVPVPEDFVFNLFGVSQLLIDSALLTHKFLTSPGYEKIGGFRKELESLIAHEILFKVFNNA